MRLQLSSDWQTVFFGLDLLTLLRSPLGCTTPRTPEVLCNAYRTALSDSKAAQPFLRDHCQQKSQPPC
jgi:hypothetical protein